MNLDRLHKRFLELSIHREEGGDTYPCLSGSDLTALAREHGLGLLETHLLALEAGFLPLRYARNVGTFGLEGQASMLRARVVVVGTGGIGGYASEMLARAGAGTIVLVDPDCFDETNLNRQDFSSEENLGRRKVEVLRERLLGINGALKVSAHAIAADSASLPAILEGACVAIDGLDTLDGRLVLLRCCARAGVVMVHGAIAGNSLEISTIYPGDAGAEEFFSAGGSGENRRGIELETGNPPTTPAIAAALQVREAIKVITGIGEPLLGRMLYVDLDDWAFEIIELS